MLNLMKGKNVNISSILKQYQGHKNMGLPRLEDYSAPIKQAKSVPLGELSDRVWGKKRNGKGSEQKTENLDPSGVSCCPMTSYMVEQR